MTYRTAHTAMIHDSDRPLPDPQAQPEFYADVPAKRFFAWVFDTIIILTVSALFVLMTAFVGLLFLPFIFLTVSFLYRTVTLAGSSATWGMRFFAIELRTLGGSRFDLPMAALHTLFYTVSIAMVAVQAVSIILMLTSERGQGLSDHLLGTAAINRRAGR